LKIDAPVRACADIAADIRAMTLAQRVRLRRVAEKYAWLYRDDAEALLQEAFCRALAGERHKPDHVDIVRFLAEVMRSVADGEAQKQENQATIIPIGGPGDLNGPVIELPEPSEGVEHRIMAAERDEEIRQACSPCSPTTRVSGT
jgi:DNA-directed RNA polymerase specialized sigma24 family protein